jgi:hypothetical protein
MFMLEESILKSSPEQAEQFQSNLVQIILV